MKIVTTTTSSLHNGPICGQCGVGFVSSHQCDPAELRRQAMVLLRAADSIDEHNKPKPPWVPPTPHRPYVAPAPVDRTAGCSCRPENGGSGICGCILGGMQITS